jgi:hypothetical protein
MWAWNRRLAAVALVALLTLAVAAVWSAHAQKPPPATKHVAITVQAKPLGGFQPREPDRVAFGPLIFRGGLELMSNYRDFGGISSLRVERDGSRFLAITDRGQWLRGRIRYAGDAPVGIDQAEMAPILGPDGKPLTTRRWYDAEALADDGGIVYVAIERVHRILWFDYGKDGVLARGQLMRVPPEFRQLPFNKGIEGMVVAPQGSPLAGTLIAFSEKSLDAAGNIRGFLIGGPSPGMFTVKRSDDFDITDAALTPNNDILILERSFSLLRGPGMRIRRVPLSEVRPGAVLEGTVLIEADRGYHIDNMEGISVHQSAAGDTVVTLISDDNFSKLQRTLLLQFTLRE